MPSLKSTLRRMIDGGASAPAGARKPRKPTALAIDRLEDRLVLSAAGVAAPTAPLYHDAYAVTQAFGTFNASYQSAVTALRSTATTTTAPTAAGLTAFDSAVSTAIQALDTTIASDLTNLPTTGTTLATTIDGYTATLQTNLEGAGAGLANSTNAAVISLYRESRPYQVTAYGQTVKAITTDTTTASVTVSSYETARKAVLSALTTFHASIQEARVSAATAGTSLDSTTVSTAVATLQASLDSAVAGLGTAFTSSASNPTTVIGTSLTTLTTALTSIAAPTAGSRASSYQFAVAVYRAEYTNAFAVQDALFTAVSGYNQGLL